MFKRLRHRFGLSAARYLMREVDAHPLTRPASFEVLRSSLRCGDVLLVEGRTRVSGPIKYLTQSTWSHAALFVGPIEGRFEKDGEPHVLIEAELIAGVCSSPLSKYVGMHTRICRPVNLRDDDLATLIGFAIERIGYQYDLHNLLDLARYLLPIPPVPSRFRRRLMSVGAAEPTRAICSTLLAQAFQAIRYPILPIVELSDQGDATMREHTPVVREILHIRNSTLYAPRDFDISPYFKIVKPTIEQGFDYRELAWV